MNTYIFRFYLIYGFLMQETTTPSLDNLSIEEKATIINNRRKTRFTSTISDERGEELLYNGKKITEFVQEWSIANVLWHLRFKKQLPQRAQQFLTTALILLADHGPAVSGAHNAIVTARAGKDVVSSVIAWLATIWPKFGWAISWAAHHFFRAIQDEQTPEQFVKTMKQRGINIPWIWHKVKSMYNPDKRCELLGIQSHQFSSTRYYQFAREVETLTTQKKPNLILNVDGSLGALLLDMMTWLDMSTQEIEQFIATDGANALFVLSRTIGFIWHHLDQKRLNEDLYRTPREDIWYTD